MKLIRAYPLTTYVVLAYVFSIAVGLMLNVSLAFGLLALFGPATAAFVVARVWRGRAGVAELWAVTTRWRVHPGWYLAALGLPIAGAAIGHVLFVLAGNPPLAIPGSVEPILILLFFLVIGEEIGWRGFLLRGMLRHQSPIVATGIVAVVWTLWHSPLYFIPGMPNYGQPFFAFAVWVVPFSFLLTWLWLGTRSALLASMMHGSGNLAASLVFPQTDPATLFVCSGVGMTLVAVPLVLRSWSRWISVTSQEDEMTDVPAMTPALD
ncbi:MAG: CPBP family intramembrane glutamic endopeptidase [Candidatus Limnocylindrales bacterium]